MASPKKLEDSAKEDARSSLRLSGPDDIEEGDFDAAATGTDIYDFEDNLHTSVKGQACTKHPGHHGFISVKEFTKDHLPDEIKGKEREKCFKFIQSKIDLVVHIKASRVSTERPEKFPHSNRRGKSAPRSGSGWVNKVHSCGQPGQGVEVEVDFIEKYLSSFRLSTLKQQIKKEWHDDESSRPPEDRFESRVFLTVSLHLWEWQLLKNAAGSKINDDFTKHLLQYIQDITACKDRHEQHGDHTANAFCVNCNQTLNDYRKMIGMGVIEFCVSMARSVQEFDVIGKSRGFWKKFVSILDKPCPCDDCKASGTPQKTWWLVSVDTAGHVIYDSQEVEGAEVSLFFDDMNSMPVVMKAMTRDSARDPFYADFKDPDSDCYSFLCVLHDGQAANRLRSSIFSEQVPNIYFHAYAPAPVIIISHPHGSTKHITIGKVAFENEIYLPFRLEDKVCVYDAPTCPGSSGGLVVHSRSDRGFMSEYKSHWYNYPHSRMLKGGYGRSGYGYYMH